MKKILSYVLALSMVCSLAPVPALAEAMPDGEVVPAEEALEAEATEEELAIPEDETALEGEAVPEDEAVPQDEDTPEEEALPAEVEPAFEEEPLEAQADPDRNHVQTARIQNINATTLASGPNYKHVATTYTYDLGKGDYPVPYSGNGWPLNYATYLQSCGIFFPGDELVILPTADPNPSGHGAHELPGLTFVGSDGSLLEPKVGDRIGPLQVTGAVTRGNMKSHSYVTRVKVVDGPVMFSHGGSGGSGSSAWATSNPDDWGNAQDWWPLSTIRYIEVPKYHPVEYHYRYRANNQWVDIPAADLKNMKFYNNQPGNPEVIWAEDVSYAFVPYLTGQAYSSWSNNKTGPEFTITRPFIEGWAYDGMEIGTHGDNFWSWEPTNNEDGQTYTTRFRYEWDMAFTSTMTEKKEGSEDDPIVININFSRGTSYPSTMTINANGGTIKGQSEWMYSYYSEIYRNSAFVQEEPPIPTRKGRTFTGWYKDKACTQIISPALDSETDLSGGKMSVYKMQRYVEAYANEQFEAGKNHFTIYAGWNEVGPTFPDVPAGKWYTQVVERAAELGLIAGYVDGRFGPDDNITRGQVAVILWRMAGQPKAKAGAKSFPDVKSGAYYYNAVRWASSVGVVNGNADGTFRPNDNVTREQLAVMLANYAKKIGELEVKGSAADYASMKDAKTVAGYAVPSVGWCFRNKIISGTNDGKVDPKGNATRAQAAKMLVFLYDLVS